MRHQKLINILCGLTFLVCQVIANPSGSIKRNVNIVDMPLRMALSSIAKMYQVDIIYADAIVEKHNVFCHLSSASVEEALAGLLQNTELTFKKSNGQFVLVRKPHLSSINIYGEVVDIATGNPLPAANITLLGSGIGAISDDAGCFHIERVPGRDYILEIDYLGYEKRRLHGTGIGVDGRLRIEMIPAEIDGEPQFASPQKGTNLVATRIPGQVIMKMEAVEQGPSLGDHDVFQTMQTLPGITGSHDGASLLYFRGSNPSHSRVTIDGLPLYRHARAFGLMSAVNSSIVNEATIYKSSFPAAYGGALGGVVDMRSRTADFDHNSFAVNLNPISAQATMDFALRKNVSLLINGRASYADYLIGDFQTNVLKPEVYHRIYGTHPGWEPFDSNLSDVSTDPRSEFYDVFAKLAIVPAEKQVLEISALHSRDLSQDAMLFAFDPGELLELERQPVRLTVDQRYDEKWQNTGIAANWHFSPGANTKIRVSSSFLHYRTSDITRNKSETSHSDYLRWKALKAELGTAKFGAEVTWKPITAFSLVAGSELIAMQLENGYEYNHQVEINAHDRIPARLKIGETTHSLLTGEEYHRRFSGYQDGDSLQTAEYELYTPGFRQLSARVSARMGAIFLESTWKPSAALTVVSGLRGSYYNVPEADIPVSYLDPRLSFYFDLFSNVVLKGAWGRYHQFINRIDGIAWDRVWEAEEMWAMANIAGNKPGSAQHEVLGAQYRTSNLLIDFEIYRKHMAGLTDYSYVSRNDRSPIHTRLPPLLQTVSRGDGFSRGAELLIQGGTRNLTMYAAYGHNKTVISTESIDLMSRFDRPHQLRLGSSLQWGKWKFAGNWFFDSGQPSREPFLTSDPLLHNGADYWTLPITFNEHLPTNHRLDVTFERHFDGRLFDGKFGLSVYNLYNQKNVFHRDYYLHVTYVDPDEQPEPMGEITGPGFTPMFYLKLDVR